MLCASSSSVPQSWQIFLSCDATTTGEGNKASLLLTSSLLLLYYYYSLQTSLLLPLHSMYDLVACYGIKHSQRSAYAGMCKNKRRVRENSTASKTEGMDRETEIERTRNMDRVFLTSLNITILACFNLDSRHSWMALQESNFQIHTFRWECGFCCRCHQDAIV